MELNEYQDRARNTAIYPKEHGLTYTVLGLVGECGEVANKAKKIIRDHGGVLTDESRSILADELGDVLWYLANVSFEVGVELETIADMNLTKLSARQASNTLKGDNRGEAHDGIKGMMQSVLKEGDIVHCFNNYIIKSVDWGNCVLIRQITVSQSLYQGFHPEFWEVDVKGVHKDVWILPQDKVEQKEVVLNDIPEQTPEEETPQEETAPNQDIETEINPIDTPEAEEPTDDLEGDSDAGTSEPSNSDEEEDTPVDESLAGEEVIPETEDGELVDPEEDPNAGKGDETPQPTPEIEPTESGPEAPAEEADAEPQPSEEVTPEEPVAQPSEPSEQEEE